MTRLIDIFFNSLGPIFLAGITVTIPLALISFIFGLIIATITALARISHLKILNKLFSFYVWVFRGTPLLVQLFIIFFGLAQIGIEFNKWTAAIIALSLNTGAYASESIRAAILSIPKGQWDAAQSIGMTRVVILRRIIFPQAFRISIPPLSNTFISLVKDTSLVSTITIVDMFMTGQRIAALYYEPLLLYCEVALIYLLFCTVLSFLQSKLERYASRFI